MLFFAFYGWLLANIITFCVYGLDKRKAIHAKWRIPEPTLIILALVGGSVGALMAMSLFRHKTQKPLFRFGVPFIAVVHALLVARIILEWFRSI